MRPEIALRSIKLLHTAVWLLVALCVMGIPVAGYTGRFRRAAWPAGVVLIEMLVLACNRLRCPLTDVAARYTEDRADNFDIFLPRWIARHNQGVFGTLFVLGSLFTLARWIVRSPGPWSPFRAGG
jgi:hypothetical protein